ncbi:hypothetical protein N7539_005399 [Penicillium diatomitis]|uniref:Vacuolar segregation subunit 7-domain-containing protein n=1 Tax=Penicillium diatomitis TaxID=2819901 RepID=A0A9W9X786_9EURO|nr:uncharacterized protein N7539_005399 [Penicillium diatomitis]KAJ5485411.1 hypothetical protein N7539_005399 [Penicillium diatomitis]
MPSEPYRPPGGDDSSTSPGSKDAHPPAADTTTTQRPVQDSNDMSEVSRSTGRFQGQAMTQVPKLLPTLPAYSASSSTCNSTVSSRESSPVRTSSRKNNPGSTTSTLSHTRKPSQDRLSPGRASSTSHSATRIPPPPPSQRASSSPVPTSNPQSLLPSPAFSEQSTNVPNTDKHNISSWAGNRRPEQDPSASNISHKRASPSPVEESGKADRSSHRPAARGMSGQGLSLETVQEMASDPSTPSSETDVKPTTPEDARLHTIDEDTTPRAFKHNPESGSDSGGQSSIKEDKTPVPATGTVKMPRTIIPQRSSASLSANARAKPADGSVRNMIVETETVTSIPQVSLGVVPGERGGTIRADPGTLRMKPSTETIRPRKEKKKTRRSNHLTNGPGTSKADIFEAKVASAVDEADVSDSDETFVYESNPPDPYPSRQTRYHSRTPSATSMASQVDQLAGRARGAMRDGAHSVTGKRSMKFTNNTYNSSLDGEVQDADGSRTGSRVDGSGTVTPRHHHVGRHGRNGVYPSLFDGDGPFPQPQGSMKSPRHFLGSGYRHSRNSNTRSSPNYKGPGGKRTSDVYDFDAEGADDERTPLVGTTRTSRSRHGRRPGSASLRQMEYMAQRERGCLSRYGSCVIFLLVMLIIAGGAASFIAAATKTLVDVQILEIQNVLASEQEIMLDLLVEAVNPNIFPVTIEDTDLNLFAKSRHVGTDNSWTSNAPAMVNDQTPRVKQSRQRWYLSQLVKCLGRTDCVEQAMDRYSKPHTGDGVDKGTDPINDPESDSQTMLLGRVYHFDSPLSFEASPWGRMLSVSKGQIRLARPGNKTEAGGTERWERVLQHPFDLIVRGTVKYQLPLSARYNSASISSTRRVIPDEDSGDVDGPISYNSTHLGLLSPSQTSSSAGIPAATYPVADSGRLSDHASETQRRQTAS